MATGEGPGASGSVTPGLEETVLARLLDTLDCNAFYDDRRAVRAQSGAPPVIISPTDSLQGRRSHPGSIAAYAVSEP